MSAIFICKSIFQCNVETLFHFHESPEGFQTLVGADPNVRVIQKPNSLEVDQKAIIEVQILPFVRVKWEALHVGYQKNVFFEDKQIKGPFLKFQHKHLFFKESENESILEDRIEFDFPILFISKYFIFQKLKSQFQARHELTAKALNVGRKEIEKSLK
jgi:ligand-binding SRPBCC domain-containing protein